MGDAVEEVHGPVDGIHDPLQGGALLPADAFLPVDGVVGVGFEEDGGDEVLRLAVEGQLHVVVLGLVDGLLLVEVRAEEGAGLAGGLNGGIQMAHGLGLTVNRSNDTPLFPPNGPQSGSGHRNGPKCVGLISGGDVDRSLEGALELGVSEIGTG